MSTDQANQRAGTIPMRFDLRELAGSLGDLGTFLPITVALAATTGLHLGWMLVAAGLMNIASGIVFRVPVPVQPMKAIAAVAIADGLCGGAVVASGWVMGVVLVVVSATGLIAWIDRLVPRPVVRAIQLGVGLKLMGVAFDWVAPLPTPGVDGLAVAFILFAVLMLGVARGWPLVLPVFLGGFAILAATDPSVYRSLSLGLPRLQWLTPTPDQWRDGTLYGALPQLPLTILNSVVAVCALSGDYFPKHAIAPKRMALSVGLMNLGCIGWSGLPMCHGSGGLAAQVRAGARTGGSVVMLGAGKVVLGLALGVSLIPLLHAYPPAVLGPLVALAGLSLAHAASRQKTPADWAVVLPAAALMAATQTLYGVALGVVLYLLMVPWVYRKPSTPRPPEPGA